MLSITNQTGLAISPRWLGRLFESLVGHPNMLGLTRHAVWVSGLPAVTETAEAWVEVWIAMVSASAAAHGTAAVDEHLWQHVTRRLLETSGNGSAAKKVRTSSFDPIVAPRQLTQQIPPGLSVLLDRLGQVVQRNIDLDHMTLSIILFPAAALRTGLAFQTILDNAPRNQSTLFLLPKLLESYRHAMYQNRHDIFIQPTSSKKSYDSYLNEKLRETLKKAMLAIEPLCVEASGSAARTTADVWSVKSSCWKAIARYGVYLESDEDWHRLLSQDAAAARHLLSGPADPQVAKAAISFLAVAETLDHMAAAVDATTYAWCLAVCLIEVVTKLIVVLCLTPFRSILPFDQYLAVLSAISDPGSMVPGSAQWDTSPSRVYIRPSRIATDTSPFESRPTLGHAAPAVTAQQQNQASHE